MEVGSGGPGLPSSPPGPQHVMPLSVLEVAVGIARIMTVPITEAVARERPGRRKKRLDFLSTRVHEVLAGAELHHPERTATEDFPGRHPADPRRGARNKLCERNEAHRTQIVCPIRNHDQQARLMPGAGHNVFSSVTAFQGRQLCAFSMLRFGSCCIKRAARWIITGLLMDTGPLRASMLQPPLFLSKVQDLPCHTPSSLRPRAPRGTLDTPERGSGLFGRVVLFSPMGCGVCKPQVDHYSNNEVVFTLLLAAGVCSERSAC